MLLLGIDVGTSSIKVSVVDGPTQKAVISVQYPEEETGIKVLQPGWAEQDPEMWWQCVVRAIQKAHASKKYDPLNIGAIGIAYQMHGLVCVDAQHKVVRDAIIWCDSRAVEIGEHAFEQIGYEKCLTHLLNSPGNFTASKLAWIKQNETAAFSKIKYVMLPGDYISLKLTGEISTTISALSEGMFWDFKNHSLSEDILRYYQFDPALIPPSKDLFSPHGLLSPIIARELGLKPGIPISYKAGDQPNNAFALHVLKPGEVAASAGTSGVIYAVSDQLTADKYSRVNSFAHVNHTAELPKIGVLLCINGTGISYSWLKKSIGSNSSYQEMNAMAAKVDIGSDGLLHYPFGNGAERMLKNKVVGSSFTNIDFNRHQFGHFSRSVQEGIACSFKYGLDILNSNGINPSIIRAGYHSLFLSDVFMEALVNITNTPVELFTPDGSVGAALGAGVGCGYFPHIDDAFQNMKSLKTIEPNGSEEYRILYGSWKHKLDMQLKALGE